MKKMERKKKYLESERERALMPPGRTEATQNSFWRSIAASTFVFPFFFFFGVNFVIILQAAFVDLR